jgi:hypothetical protein
VDYSVIQNNLGSTCTDLVGVRNKEKNLEKATKTFEENINRVRLGSSPKEMDKWKISIDLSTASRNSKNSISNH